MEELLRFPAPVGFDEADDDLRALLARRPGRLKHGIGLAHAGRRPEKDLEAAAPLPVARASSASGEARGVSVRAMRAYASVVSGYITPSLRTQPVEGQIDAQDVDAGLPEDPEGPPLGRGFDHVPDLLFRKVPGRGDAGGLRQRKGRGDVRVEAAAGGGDGIPGDRLRQAGLAPGL